MQPQEDNNGTNPKHHNWMMMTTIIFIITIMIGPALYNKQVIGDGVDLHGTIWFYNWIFECINNLKDPGFTDQFYYPYGKDIFAHTGNNFADAVLFYPLKLIIKYPYNYVIFIGIILFLNALSMYLLLRHCIDSKIIQLCGVLFSLTSPFVLFELVAGRPTQACLFVAPLAIVQFLVILEGKGSIKSALLLGFYVALQGYFYWFYAYFLAAVLLALLISKKNWASVEPKQLVKQLAVALSFCMVLVLPMIFEMLNRIQSEVVPGLNVVTASFTELPSLQNNVLTTLHGLIELEGDDQPIYTVLPWFIGLVLCMAHPESRKKWGLAFVVTVVGSLGPVFTLFDFDVNNWPYLAAYNYLPFYSRLWFPYRWVSMGTIVILVGGCVALDKITRDYSTNRKLLVAIAPLILALPQLHLKNMFPLKSESLDTPGIYLEMSQHWGAIIELPIGISKKGIAYQAEHGLPTFGGMGENARIFSPPKHLRRLRNGFILYLRKVIDSRGEAQAFNNYQLQRLIEQDYRYVILDRALTESYCALNEGLHSRNNRPFEVQNDISKALGDPWGVQERYVVWALRDTPLPSEPFKPTDDALNLHTWDVDQSLMGATIERDVNSNE